MIDVSLLLHQYPVYLMTYLNSLYRFPLIDFTAMDPADQVPPDWLYQFPFTDIHRHMIALHQHVALLQIHVFGLSYEELFFRVDPSLKELRDLKERYVRFNTINAGRPQKAALELDQLIDSYAHCEQNIFVRFSRLLKRHRESIINSFILVDRLDRDGRSIVSRLSNGPIESMNRKAKDLKRLGRGYRNFDHLRNRFLYATRMNPELDGREQSPLPGPHAIRYRSTVLKSRQRTLNAELESILEKYVCTDDELLALRHWVAEGNSPFENPDGIFNDSGLMCDFIAASRILDKAFDNDSSSGGDSV